MGVFLLRHEAVFHLIGGGHRYVAPEVEEHIVEERAISAELSHSAFVGSHGLVVEQLVAGIDALVAGIPWAVEMVDGGVELMLVERHILGAPS